MKYLTLTLQKGSFKKTPKSHKECQRNLDLAAEDVERQSTLTWELKQKRKGKHSISQRSSEKIQQGKSQRAGYLHK